MSTEVKSTIFALVAAIFGSAIGAFATLQSTELKAGSTWDLSRTKYVLDSAKKDYQINKEVEYSGWVCYHSILWDCANSEWSITNDSKPALAAACKDIESYKTKKSCPLRERSN